MNDNRFKRLELLVGERKLKHLSGKHVAIFGVGGVGSFTAEALARSGVERLTIIDYDTVDITNINRQIHADDNSVGMIKVEAMKKRLASINPNMSICAENFMFTPQNADDFFEGRDFDYIVDAIDMVTSKIELVLQAEKRNIKIIASMGTGNKLDPSRLMVTDIYKTSVCPLCKVMRKELKVREVKSLKVVFSDEEPIKPDYSDFEANSNFGRKFPPGSCSFVPSSAGLLLASYVIREFLSEID